MVCSMCNAIFNPDLGLHYCSVYPSMKKHNYFTTDYNNILKETKESMEEKKKSPGNKFDTGKAPISLIPKEALEEEAKALGFGASKYGRFNFKGGIEYSRLIDAAMRHILAFADGEDLDPEAKTNHIGNARANLGMLLWMINNKPEMDDRYKEKKDE